MTSPATDQLDPRLTSLANRPADVSLGAIWKALTRSERADAVRTGLDDPNSSVATWAIDQVARKRHFRRKSVERWEPAKIAEAAALLTPRSPGLLEQLLANLHLGHRRPLLAAYLDGLGIPHEDGTLASDDVDPGVDEVEYAASSLLGRFPHRDVVIYFLTLRLLTPALVPEIGRWLPALVPSGEVGPQAPDEATEEEVPGEAPRPDQTDEFTTLDRQLVRSIIDAAQGVQGALDEDELLDLVEELIELNSARHRSFFHLGLADVVLGREERSELPAQNEARLRWYWSGFVNGLAREARWPEIVDLFEEQEIVRDLGQSGAGPSSSATALIFQALCRADRPAEAAGFLTTRSLVENPVLTRLVHDQGRQLLWEDRAPEARPLMDLLGAALRSLEEAGLDVSTRFFLEIQRRRAHCFRQLGELPKARSILERLLEDESDEEVRAMVLADLGLVAGGFRSLASVRLPDEEDGVTEVRAALEQGEDRFREAASGTARYGAHGRYCLGVLAATNEAWDEAASDLERALSVFEAEPARYGAGGLVERARLYVGIALALGLDVVRVDRATELVETALGSGADVPEYLAGQLIESVQLGSGENAQRIAEALLRHTPELLDRFLDSEVMSRSTVLVDALLARAEDEARASVARARDYRAAVPHALRQERLDTASRILDRLEALAHERVGEDEFLALLESPESYDPAWSATDAFWARLQLLRMMGRGDDAVPLLHDAFFRALHGGRFDGREEAEDILEVLKAMGRPDEECAPLEEAFAATAEGDDAIVEEAAELPLVRILFVGGDERQETTTREIKEELRDSHPRLSVDFIHPGWSGHWGPTLDRVRASLDEYDAVVIMRFIRTEFGRQLRASVDVPWTACTGAGRSTIKRSVVRAARWARDAR